MDADELKLAAHELASLLRKCEAVLERSSLSVSRTTLMTRRIAALRTAAELVRQAQSDNGGARTSHVPMDSACPEGTTG